jgi:DNA invertase Pin-like site-specific DNA recombinase
MDMRAAIYARVSTKEQDDAIQLYPSDQLHLSSRHIHLMK